MYDPGYHGRIVRTLHQFRHQQAGSQKAAARHQVEGQTQRAELQRPLAGAFDEPIAQLQAALPACCQQ